MKHMTTPLRPAGGNAPQLSSAPRLDAFECLLKQYRAAKFVPDKDLLIGMMFDAVAADAGEHCTHEQRDKFIEAIGAVLERIA